MRAGNRNTEWIATHEHNDLTSFTLYFQGNPVVIDVGRLNYTNSHAGKYGKLTTAHNTLIIDGCGPVAEDPSWFMQSYAAVTAHVDCESNSAGATIRLRHNGFGRRAHGPIMHERVIHLMESEVAVRDRLDGTGSCETATRFHLSADAGELADGTKWTAGNGTGAIEPDSRLELSLITGEDEGGVTFDGYGKSRPTRTLELRGHVELPITLSHRIVLRST